jgi:hypothetical protein
VRKSTVVVLAILLAGMGLLLWAFRLYTDQFKEEIANAKALTEEVRGRLAPETRLRLVRVAGSGRYLVTDPSRVGLLLEASPSAETWAGDAAGRGFAADLARRLFAVYGAERPAEWVQVRLLRLDGTEAPPLAFERGADGLPTPVAAPRAP